MFVRTSVLLLIATGGAWAQYTCPTPGALSGGNGSIGGINDGAELKLTTSWYDQATETLQVPALTYIGSCSVRIQGMIPWEKTPGRFIVEVPLSLTSPQWAGNAIHQGLRLSQIPYIAALTDPHRVYKPLVFELIDNATQVVMVSLKIVIVDKRPFTQLTALSTRSGRITNSAAIELTRTGADKLERVMTGVLPQPNKAAFDASLTARFQNTVQVVTPPTLYTSGSKACVPLTSVDPDFLNTSAYAAAITLSAFSYGAWKTADEICQKAGPLGSPSCTVANSICVRDVTPSAANFELCTERISGSGKSLTMEKVESTDLSITSAAPLTSRIITGRLDATVEGSLDDLFIRWSDNHAGCVVRPTTHLSASDQVRSAILAWRKCEGLEADATSALSNSINHNLYPYMEALTTTATATLPLFTLAAGKPLNAEKGACSSFKTHVETLLNLYYPAVQSALDTSWLSQHSLGADDVTSRWEMGANETMADVDLTMSPGNVMQRSNDRFWIYYHTETDVPTGAPASNYHALPFEFPCVDTPAGVPAVFPCLPGQSRFGTQFDASYTVTTNALNQVLRTRHNKLAFTASYNDLGLPAPAGKSGSDMWQVDGTWLSALFPALSELGNTRLRLKLEPLNTPFTVMPPDPKYYLVAGAGSNNFDPTGRSPLTYQVAQYKVILEGDQPGPNGSRIWALFFVDMYDPDFQLSFSTVNNQNVLLPSYGRKSSIWRMVQSQFTGCPAAPLGDPAKCGNRLLDLVAAATQPKLDTLMLEMISGYPAPQFFDGRGKTTQTRKFKQFDKYQEVQVITFYGNLE
ncbi:MAG: hypothetical protein JNL98_04075 [Bryobacterales bacterium]|nr:hypothetical protein [Bryobacterales bacterium]